MAADDYGRGAIAAVLAAQLLTGRQSVKGWYSGTSIDSQDTLAFSAASGRAVDERS